MSQNERIELIERLEDRYRLGELYESDKSAVQFLARENPDLRGRALLVLAQFEEDSHRKIELLKDAVDWAEERGDDEVLLKSGIRCLGVQLGTSKTVTKALLAKVTKVALRSGNPSALGTVRSIRALVAENEGRSADAFAELLVAHDSLRGTWHLQLAGPVKLMLVLALYNANRLKEAVELANQVPAGDGERGALYLQLGTISFRNGDFGAAIDLFERAIACPGVALAHRSIARGALIDAREKLANVPASVEDRLDHDSGDLDADMGPVALEPSDSSDRAARARFWCDRGSPESALAEVRAGLSECVDAEAHGRLLLANAEAFAAGSDFVSAFAALEEADDYPLDSVSQVQRLLLLADLELRTGGLQRAREFAFMAATAAMRNPEQDEINLCAELMVARVRDAQMREDGANANEEEFEGIIAACHRLGFRALEADALERKGLSRGDPLRLECAAGLSEDLGFLARASKLWFSAGLAAWDRGENARGSSSIQRSFDLVTLALLPNVQIDSARISLLERLRPQAGLITRVQADFDLNAAYATSTRAKSAAILKLLVEMGATESLLTVPSLDEMRAAIPDDSVLVDFLFTHDEDDTDDAEGVLVFVISRTDVVFRALQWPREAREAIDALRRLLSGSIQQAVHSGMGPQDFFAHRGRESHLFSVESQLYQFLLKPIERQWAPYPRLILCTGAQWADIPFYCLRNGDGVAVVDTKVITRIITPEGIGARAPVVESGSRAVVVRGEDRCLPTLEYADAEVAAVARSLRTLGFRVSVIGPGSSKDEVVAEIERARVVHFAGHARFDTDDPMRSFLETPSQRLFASDLVNLDLDACRLVTLGACETGRVGTGVGEEMVGMLRALSVAGAQAIVCARWRADDRSSAELLCAMYELLHQHDDVAWALRESILRLRTKGGPFGEWLDPWHWANYACYFP